MPAFKIETDDLSTAVAQFIQQFKASAPGVGKFRCTGHCGSTFTIVVKNKPIRRAQVKRLLLWAQESVEGREPTVQLVFERLRTARPDVTHEMIAEVYDAMRVENKGRKKR